MDSVGVRALVRRSAGWPAGGLAQRLNWHPGMNRHALLLALITYLITPSLGCFDLWFEPAGDDPWAPCAPRVRGEVNPAGTHSLFVVDSVRFATSWDEVNTVLGMDFDQLEPLRNDNLLGGVLATVFGGLGTNVESIVASMIADGRILHLIDVQSVGRQTADGVGVSVFLGLDLDGDPGDNFTGVETFGVVDPFAGETMVGAVTNGHIEAELGAMPLQIALPGSEEPFVLNLGAARIEADFDDDRLIGLIGGVLSEAQVQDEFLPIVHTAMARSIALQCEQGVCEPGSNGAVFLDLFDSDGDGELSLDEVRENDLIRALLAPDLDLFDENGLMAPGCDMTTESLSFVVGFTAVPAQF